MEMDPGKVDTEPRGHRFRAAGRRLGRGLEDREGILDSGTATEVRSPVQELSTSLLSWMLYLAANPAPPPRSPSLVLASIVPYIATSDS